MGSACRTTWPAPPGDIVFLDNLGSHKGKAVRKAVRATGARLFFLPPHNPHLNLIERAFSKLKHLLRKSQARSFDEIHNAVGPILERFELQECAAYLANSGYASA